jgi:RNA polymerase sigma factor (sigma-70 family)
VNDFDEFFAEHYARVVGSLTLACGDAGAAEDAAQEGFTKAMVRWRTVSQYERPATWIYVVAVRDLRRGLRRRERSTVTDEVMEEPVIDPAGDAVTAAVITDALDRLAPRQRLAVVLRFHSDLSVPDVARAMRCSEGAVKSTLHAALRRLRVDLGDRSLEGAADGAA